jgi:hypothetical protein
MSNVVWGFPNPQAIVVESEKKKYVAQFYQSGTSNPTVNVLEDSTGFANTWTRQSVGSYILTFGPSITVPLDKLFIPGWLDFTGARTLYLPVSNGNQIDGRLVVYPYWSGPLASGILIECVDDQWVPVEWSTLFGASGYNLEFYIYP